MSKDAQKFERHILIPTGLFLLIICYGVECGHRRNSGAEQWGGETTDLCTLTTTGLHQLRSAQTVNTKTCENYSQQDIYFSNINQTVKKTIEHFQNSVIQQPK